MKKVYYLGHCGTGTARHYQLIDLVKDDGKKLLFHINDFDWDKGERRTITLRAERVTRFFNGTPYEKIDFHSTKKQYKFHFITELEIEDNAKPEETMILH